MGYITEQWGQRSCTPTAGVGVVLGGGVGGVAIDIEAGCLHGLHVRHSQGHSELGPSHCLPIPNEDAELCLATQIVGIPGGVNSTAVSGACPLTPGPSGHPAHGVSAAGTQALDTLPTGSQLDSTKGGVVLKHWRVRAEPVTIPYSFSI